MSTVPATSVGTRRPRSWRWIMGATIGGLLLAMMLLNIIADPYCAYRSLPSLYEFKPYYDRPETKAELVASLKPVSVILGGEPALVINPRWSGWGPYGALNLAMAATSLEQEDQALQFAISRGRVERVLLCLDLWEFQRLPMTEGFERSRFSPSFSPVSYHLENLFSPQTSGASLSTIAAYASGHQASYTLLGDVRGGKFPYVGPSRARFVHAIKEEKQKFTVLRPSSQALAALRSIVNQCHSKKIELSVVIAPVHALYLETLAAQEHEGEYERWLQDVVNVVDEESEGALCVWDFSGYNRYTTEEPPPTDRSPAPKYYQEPGLFTAALGDLILDRVYNQPGGDAAFGTAVRPVSLDRRIKALHDERQAWLAQRPAALSLLGVDAPDLVAETPR